MMLLRDRMALATVLLYLLFNYGFMQLRIPPTAGGGLPVGEIVLLLSLMTINYTSVLGRLSTVIAILPLSIWWGFGVSRALFDFGQHGMWALRDAAHVLESLFLLVGFVYAGKNLERFFELLPKFLCIGVGYGFLYPWHYEILVLSPTITSGAGYEAAIFGNMATAPYLLILGAFYLLIFKGDQLPAIAAAVLLLAYTLAVFQARTLYLILIAVFAFVVLYRRSMAGHVGLVALLSGFLLMVVTLLGLQVAGGRLGVRFDAEFMLAHFMAIFGVCDPSIPAVCSAAEGVGQRLEWWNSIFERMMQDAFHMLLGLGYGVPLTDFYGSSGAAVREPHNSYITVLARNGVVGAVCWGALMLSMLYRWRVTFQQCRALEWRTGENRLLILMVFFISMWVLALGEDGFEKPYNIIPFYFFWGIVLRMSYELASDNAIVPLVERVRSTTPVWRPLSH